MAEHGHTHTHTSVERSHAVGSNLKLMFLSLSAAFFFAALFALTGIYAVREEPLYMYMAAGAGTLAALHIVLIRLFRR